MMQEKLNQYKVFQIQDQDRPMFVIEKSWTEALEAWREVIRIENDIQSDEEIEPLGISRICDWNELILPKEITSHLTE